MAELENFVSRFGKPQAEGEGEPLAERPGALAAFIGKFGTETESFWFYNHTVEVRFEKEPHLYYLVGELGNLILLDNVSTVAKIIDRSERLVPWAAKMVAEKILRIVPIMNLPDGNIMLPGMPLEDFTKLVMEAKTAPRDTLEDAGDVGHMAHAWIERYIKAKLAGEPLPELGCPDERATNCCKATLKWEAAHNVRWVETERKVYSREHRCSGTLDGVGLVDSCSDPLCCPVAFKDHLSLIDWKTSNYMYVDFLYQTAAYQAFRMEEFPETVIVDRWINRLGKDDAEFDPWHLSPEDFQDDFDGFIWCLQLKRINARVENRMKALKKFRRAAEKSAAQAAKELALALAKDAKAREKAAERIRKEEEKQKLKEDAKAAREAAKEEAKRVKEAAKVAPVVSVLAEELKENLATAMADLETFVNADNKLFKIPTEENK